MVGNYSVALGQGYFNRINGVSFKLLQVCVLAAWICEGRRHDGDFQEAHDRGVLFKLADPGKLFIEGRHIIIPFRIELDRLFQPFQVGRDNLHHIHRAISYDIPEVRDIDKDLPMLKRFQRHIQQLGVHLNHTEATLRSFLQKKQQRHVGFGKHSKRGLLNVVGKVSSYLFGTATQEQIDTINKHVTRLETLTETERRTLNLHSRILKEDHALLHKLGKGLQTLSQSVIHSMIKFGRMENSMYWDIQIIDALLELAIGVDAVARDTGDLKDGLESMFQGTLDERLVEDDTLLNLLTDHSIPQHELLVPAKSEYLEFHRDSARVDFTFRSVRELIFYILLPLKNDVENVFELYKITALPMHLRTDTTISIELPDKFLAISENRMHHFTLQTLDDCREVLNVWLCPPIMPIFTPMTPSCAYTIFTKSDKAEKLCRKTVSKTFVPHYQFLGQAAWGFSLPTAETFQLLCENRTGMTSATLNLQGRGVFKLRKGCSAYSKHVTIPKHATHTIDHVVHTYSNHILNSSFPLSDLQFSFINSTFQLPHLANVTYSEDLVGLLHSIPAQPMKENILRYGPAMTVLVALLILAAIFCLKCGCLKKCAGCGCKWNAAARE